MFPWSRTVLRRRVVIRLTTGRTFEGVAFAKSGPLLVLRDASIIDAGQSTPMDGEVVIPRARIEFIQVPPERTA